LEIGWTCRSGRNPTGKRGAAISRKQRRRQEILAGTSVTVGATLLMGGTAQAACNCTVDSLADPTDPGHTTLRDAITSAETSANSGSTITFASGLSGTITLASQLPTISYPTTIQGPGAGQIAISGDDADRILHMRSLSGPFPVTISGLTLTHGNVSGQSGGAIYSYNAQLTISDAILSGNASEYGGGAVWAYSGLGTLTIENSTLTGNSASGGGAIYDVGTPLTIQNSTLSGNQAVSRGGAIGIDIPSAPSTIVDSTLTGNMSTGNYTASRGGGIYIYGAYYGLTVSGSTVAGNSAREGGGIFNHSAFASPSPVLNDVLVANNSVSVGAPDLGGPFDSAFSLIESTAGATVSDTVAGSDIIGQDPRLGPLSSNGGPTQTMTPLCGSPAIDKGSASSLTEDQRGLSRPVELADYPNSTAAGADGSDIGSVELQTSPGMVCTPPPQPFAATPVKKKKCKKKRHKRSAESAKKKKCKKKKKKR
jgi:hypothetical protein